MIIAEHLAFPEGPAFDRAGNLWFVELEGGTLTRWNDGQLTRHHSGGMPNGLAFDGDNRAWFCDAGQNAIRRFDPRRDTWETVADRIDGAPLLMPNDLAFDSAGNLVFTCPGDVIDAPDGYVCCLRPDGTLHKIAEHLYFPNGLAFGKDGRTLIVAETYRQRLWRGGWDADTCRWTAPHVWAEVGGTTDGPDGMAFAADGSLYVAVYSLGCIRIVDTAGQIIADVPLAGRNPTNVAFDPRHRLGLVVTEAEHGTLLALPEHRRGQPLFDRHTWETA